MFCSLTSLTFRQVLIDGQATTATLNLSTPIHNKSISSAPYHNIGAVSRYYTKLYTINCVSVLRKSPIFLARSLRSLAWKVIGGQATIVFYALIVFRRREHFHVYLNLGTSNLDIYLGILLPASPSPMAKITLKVTNWYVGLMTLTLGGGEKRKKGRGEKKLCWLARWKFYWRESHDSPDPAKGEIWAHAFGGGTSLSMQSVADPGFLCEGESTFGNNWNHAIN